MQPFGIYKGATQRRCIYTQMECFSDAYVALCLSQLLLHKKGEDIYVYTLIPAYFCFIAVIISPQNHSKFLADTIGTSLRGLLDDQVICLLQSFIYPKEMMIKRAEAPPLLDENAQRFALTKDLQVKPMQQQGVGKQRDPILELFCPPTAAKEGKNVNILKLRVHKFTLSFHYIQISLILDYVTPWRTWLLPSLHVLLSQTTCGTTCLQQMN